MQKEHDCCLTSLDACKPSIYPTFAQQAVQRVTRHARQRNPTTSHVKGIKRTHLIECWQRQASGALGVSCTRAVLRSNATSQQQLLRTTDRNFPRGLEQAMSVTTTTHQVVTHPPRQTHFTHDTYSAVRRSGQLRACGGTSGEAAHHSPSLLAIGHNAVFFKLCRPLGLPSRRHPPIERHASHADHHKQF